MERELTSHQIVPGGLTPALQLLAEIEATLLQLSIPVHVIHVGDF